MNHLFNSEQKMTEIIFAHRNKAYGAYAIRSSYGETTLKAIGLMLTGMTSILTTAWYFSHNNPPTPDQNGAIVYQDSVYVIPFKLNEDKPKPDVPADPPAEKNAGSENSTATSTVIDEHTETTTTTETLSGSETSSVETTSPGGTEGGTGTVNTNTGSAIGSSVGVTSTITEVYKLDKMPQFKGGLAALNNFIKSKVRYPDAAVEENRQGLLYVRFIVDEKGRVSHAELLNTSYTDLNAEALRVVGLIPDFESPGIANGQPVKTYYQVPINFKLR